MPRLDGARHSHPTRVYRLTTVVRGGNDQARIDHFDGEVSARQAFASSPARRHEDFHLVLECADCWPDATGNLIPSADQWRVVEELHPEAKNGSVRQARELLG